MYLKCLYISQVCGHIAQFCDYSSIQGTDGMEQPLLEHAQYTTDHTLYCAHRYGNGFKHHNDAFSSFKCSAMSN